MKAYKVTMWINSDIEKRERLRDFLLETLNGIHAADFGEAEVDVDAITIEAGIKEG